MYILRLHLELFLINLMLKSGDSLPLEVIYSFLFAKEGQSDSHLFSQSYIYRQGCVFVQSEACAPCMVPAYCCRLTVENLLSKLMSKNFGLQPSLGVFYACVLLGNCLLSAAVPVGYRCSAPREIICEPTSLVTVVKLSVHCPRGEPCLLS